MAAVIYLDADDEITSAASRMRVADEKRVALVVPYGSRLATSRINFRLLAREAQARGHRLSVVAADAATRALAASAGLPVFASVGEYEEAETVRPAPDPDAAGRGETATAAEPAGWLESAEADERGGRAGLPGRRRRRSSDGNGSGRGADDDGAPGMGPGAAGGAAAGGVLAAAAAERASAGHEGTQPVAVAPSRPPGGASATMTRATARPAAATAGATTVSTGVTGGPRAYPWGGRRGAWPYGQTVAIAAAGIVALALLALAVGAYVLLPSARATVAIPMERIGPVPMEIRADPQATAPDVEAGVIPAQRLTFDVAASGVFPATGRRVESSRARGEVRFVSKNPVDENNIGAGSIVSTPNGVQFRTTERLTIPKATIVGLTVVPGEGTVAIEAVESGTNGNVPANAITVVPSNEDPMFLEVRNPEPTRGGSRREFPVVEQTDVDAARAALETQLDTEFGAILADAGRVPPGLTLFGQSRRLDNVLPTTDPATLVGQEVEEFPLGLAATGTVMAVDPSPVETVSAQRIADSVDAGYRLVDGSIDVTPGEPVVDGEAITFPVTATAFQVRIIDAGTLRAQIKGKRVTEARAILDGYGEVDLSVWPDWVSTIPTIDARLEVRVELPEGLEPSSPSGSAPPGGSAPPSGSAAPSTSGSSSSAGPPSAAPSGAVASPASSGTDPGLQGESPPP